MTSMFRAKLSAISVVLLVVALTVPLAGIEKEPLAEYASRRARVAAEIKGGALILYGNPDSDLMKFKQEDYFYYLTGFSEPDAVLVLDATGDEVEETLFIRARNRSQERWTGVTMSTGSDGEKATGVKSVRVRGDLADAMARIVQKGKKIYALTSDKRSMDQVRALSATDVQNAAPIIASFRIRKAPTELALLEKTVKITLTGQEAAARTIAPGVWEYEVEAAVEYEFRRRGAERPSFPSIIGSGPFSTVLHYSASTRQMQAGDLVVVDIGAEYSGYAGDVTRTYPVSGKFTPRQREIYQIVLDAQRAALAMVRPGVTFRQIHEAAFNLISAKGYGPDFIHTTNHHLGLYVHDVGDQRRPMEPGMVITVEPGIYLEKEQLGVRIEDDVIITENGYRMLSDFPKEIADIEALMARSSSSPQR